MRFRKRQARFLKSGLLEKPVPFFERRPYRPSVINDATEVFPEELSLLFSSNLCSERQVEHTKTVGMGCWDRKAMLGLEMRSQLSHFLSADAAG
jgi:hypothetical protein